MCFYTYHHYPLCGHISNWTVTSCLEFTNRLRVLAGSGQAVSCKDVETTHDLLPTAQHHLCVQCELEREDLPAYDDRDALLPTNYRAIEGLNAKSPIIEFAVRMTIDVRDQVASPSPSEIADDDQSGGFADIARSPGSRHCYYCYCCHSSESPLPSVYHDPRSDVRTGSDLFSDIVSDCVKPLGLGDDVASRSGTGKKYLDTNSEEIPYEYERRAIAELVTALGGNTPSGGLIDSSSIYTRNSSVSASSLKAANSSTETLEHPKLKTTFSSDALWNPDLSDESSLHFRGHPPYDWISDIERASTEIWKMIGRVASEENRVQEQSDTETADQSSQPPWTYPAPSSDHSDANMYAVREYTPVDDRPGTPYERMNSASLRTQRQFIAADSKEEARELGLRCPLRIGNLYAGC